MQETSKYSETWKSSFSPYKDFTEKKQNQNFYLFFRELKYHRIGLEKFGRDNKIGLVADNAPQMSS